MSDLDLRQRSLAGGVVLIEAEGVLDARTFDEMRNLLEALLRSGSHRLVVRLDKVREMSSVGAGFFLGAVDQAKNKGGGIVLVVSQPVRAVFTQLGLATSFQIANTERQALGLFGVNEPE